MLESFLYVAVIQQHKVIHRFVLLNDALDGVTNRFVYTSPAEQWPMGIQQYLNLPHGVINVAKLWLLSSSST